MSDQELIEKVREFEAGVEKDKVDNVRKHLYEYIKIALECAQPEWAAKHAQFKSFFAVATPDTIVTPEIAAIVGQIMTATIYGINPEPGVELKSDNFMRMVAPMLEANPSLLARFVAPPAPIDPVAPPAPAAAPAGSSSNQ
jgi:hypothetical protein